MRARPALEAGTVLGGRFRILGEIGAGTMGTVYAVEHELTRHRRALKLLHPALRAHPETWARFRREATIAARLGCPQVVEVLDAGELEEGHAYVLMELLEGESMASLLARRAPLPVPRIAALVREAALGLHAAHEAGIVHRDVKPANLFVCDGGRVKVLDFGICRFDPELTQLESETMDPSVLGTPAYMAPEQVRGARDLDRRVDVWALGAILHLGATGARPFRAGTVTELAVAIDRGHRVSLAEVAPALPAAFASVIDRAMALERDDRFPTAAALADALAPFAAGAEPVSVDADGDRTLDPIAPSDAIAEPAAETLDPRDLVTAEPDPPPDPPRGAPRALDRRALVIGVAIAALAGVTLLLSRASTQGTSSAPATSASSAPSGSTAPLAPLATVASVSTEGSVSAEPPVEAAFQYAPPSVASVAKKAPKPLPVASGGVPLHRDNPYR